MALEKPLIVTEGKTDPLYLRPAISKLRDDYPQLGEVVDGKFSSAVRFLRYSDTTDRVFELGGGTSHFNKFFGNYKNTIDSFKFKPLAHPVIFLIDNDDGEKKVFNIIENKFKREISLKTSEPFYHLHENLYLVKTPENGKDGKSCIEDLFDPKWFKFCVDGKTFDPSKKHNKDSNTYSKTVFAKKVVIPNADKIDFSKFGKLLDRIVAVLGDYEKRKS